MKKFSLIFVLFLIVIGNGCSAYYGNEEQYDNGDWYFLSSSEEVARTKEDKLAFDKLKSQSAKTGSNAESMGYEGVIKNFNTHLIYDFHIRGPEKKSFLLGPGEERKEYLIPGIYTCYIFRSNRQVGPPSNFRVGPRKHIFLGEEVHWYVYME